MALFAWSVVVFVVAFASRALLIRLYVPNRRSGWSGIDSRRHWWEFVATVTTCLLPYFVAAFFLTPPQPPRWQLDGGFVATFIFLEVLVVLGVVLATWRHNRRFPSVVAGAEVEQVA